MAEGARRVEVSFATGNDAFRYEDGSLDRSAVSAMLQDAATAVELGRDRAALVDHNGNVVGELVVHGESEGS